VGATTGKEGLEKIKTEKPDLIILDIMLPGGLNGFDVAEQMRKDPQTAYIPLLILTNLDSEKQSAMAVGAADYLVKSNTSIEDVIKKIRQLLGIV
jgi:CheY-like chemotaxis protein